MNNTLNRLSRDRLSGQPEQYKKFNPNPTPQRSWWDIEKPFEPVKPFPSYEEWKTQVEAGTLPEEFKKEVPGKELLEQHGGLPLELQTPTEQPTETGMPTETGYPDVLNQIMGTYGIEDPLEALQLFIDMSAGEQETLGYQPPPKEDKPVNYFDFTQQQAEDAYASGEWDKDRWATWMQIQKDRGSLDKILGEGEGAKVTPIDIMTMGKEQEFTTQDQYINALMGEVGMNYNEALTFYQTFSGSHPDYPRDY